MITWNPFSELFHNNRHLKRRKQRQERKDENKQKRMSTAIRDYFKKGE
jgi:hypothetical protein